MNDNYWVLAVISFLFVLCKIKYESIQCLRECIMEYLSNLSSLDVIEEPDDILELEELTDMIATFIIENKELFCNLKYKVEE